ncbi:MAG: SIS domain-containing protein [Phycisphaeraceae bacterium]
MRELLRHNLDELSELLPKVAELGPRLAELGERMATCWDVGGKVLVAGNGGSCADAMHLAEELSVRFKKNRRALAALALSDAAALTCAGNDFGYERVFERQVEALGRAGDVLIVLSTSGNSENLVRAARAGRERGLMVAGLLGCDGGKLRSCCDLDLTVPCRSTARIQEMHKLLFHTLCEWVDRRYD